MHSYERLPPFDGLVAMLAAAEQGSFSAAAESLGLTHGSVSRRIAQLEHWLGAAVFERQARGVVLTPAGQRFAATASKAVGLLTEQAEQWRPRKGQQRVRLSMVPSFARLWLIPRLAELQGDDLIVDLITEHRPSDLDAREADIAIRYGTGPFHDVDAQLLFSEDLVPCASPQIATGLLAHPSGEELLRHCLIHDSNHGHWQAWLAREGIRYHPRASDRRFEDYDLVLEAAAAGLGIALLRRPLADSWVERRALTLLSNDALANSAAHHIVMRRGEQRPEVLELGRRIKAASPIAD
ncbi:MAG: LysR substrate-binding domain-containing protein [Sphingorhabdus sp.]